MNLIESLQKQFGYDPLHKIDPNTQDLETGEAVSNEHQFNQAAIPVILTGIHRFTATDTGAEEVLNTQTSTGWVNKLFAEDANEVISRVADYSGFDKAATQNKLNEMAAKATELIREAVSPGNKMMDVKDLMEAQINNILTFLPATLHMGDLLNENTIDDRTNKMEGPISSLIQAIGSGFSKADKDEKKEDTI
ncbi:MAG TPA: hypothetical protein VLR49_04890 [Ferruginibacter sp.]|nr:hypothetical protein [Ferruginibacter sp.]